MHLTSYAIPPLFSDVIPIARSLAIHSMKDVILIIDHNDCLIDFNLTAQKLFNLNLNDNIGQSITEVLSQFPDLNNYYESNSQFGENEFIFKKDGKQYIYDYTNTSIKDYNDLTIGKMILLRDITDRKKIEYQLIKEKEIAENSNQAKTEFISNMSHELRTPMNAIIGMTTILLGMQLNQQQRDYIDIIKIASEDLLCMINDILDISKIHAKELNIENAEFSIREVIQNVLNSVKLKASDKCLELNLFVDDSIPHNIKGDYSKIHQILLNLVENAIKFTEKGAISISITVQKVHETNSHLKIKFEIKDKGIGINTKYYNRLFKSFSQIDSSKTRKYDGAGLGLYLSKNLVEIMGGEIGFESEENQGSVFWFVIPFEKNLKYSLKILLIENNFFDQEIIQGILKNYTLTIVDNMNSALEILNKKKFDIVFLNLELDIEPLNIRDIDTHIIGLAHDDIDNKNFTIKDIIYKPIVADKLFEAIYKL